MLLLPAVPFPMLSAVAVSAEICIRSGKQAQAEEGED